jgi:anthranilate synthase component 2
MKKILVIDNYDSFTYNLGIEDLNCEVTRNDEFEIDEIAHLIKYYFPGPGIPEEGLCKRSHKKNMVLKVFWCLLRTTSH